MVIKVLKKSKGMVNGLAYQSNPDGDQFDRRKCRRIFKRYHLLMRAVAFGVLKDARLAKDAMKDAMLKALKYSHRINLKDRSGTKQLMCLLAKNAAVDLSRRRQSQLLPVQTDEDL